MKYDYSISVARVLAMLSIIVCHLLSACHINDFQIAAVMVDVFLFISGYLYGLKQIADGRKWLKARFRRIIVPQWVNLAIYGVLCGAFCKPFSVLGGVCKSLIYKVYGEFSRAFRVYSLRD
jgi:peptidoglycan/LPS O-acetylase OafA/YrhL